MRPPSAGVHGPPSPSATLTWNLCTNWTGSGRQAKATPATLLEAERSNSYQRAWSSALPTQPVEESNRPFFKLSLLASAQLDAFRHSSGTSAIFNPEPRCPSNAAANAFPKSMLSSKAPQTRPIPKSRCSSSRTSVIEKILTFNISQPSSASTSISSLLPRWWSINVTGSVGGESVWAFASRKEGKVAGKLGSTACALAFGFKRSPFPRSKIKEGMPFTRNVFDSACFRSRSAKGIAYQGIVPKYSLKECSSLSEDTKIISKLLPFALQRL
mmetsp:Transcript_26087/g.56586  ORF Transcript_26087/g.56586 Transcript_26087/m.56586 type:complete len:271 (+) Transcript_26087:1883-2695(+)